MKLVFLVITAVALLGGCMTSAPTATQVLSPQPTSAATPTATPTSTPAPTSTLGPTATPEATPGISHVGSCSEMLDATDGRIVLTFGDGRANGIATVNADGSGYQEIVEQGPTREQPHGGTESPHWAPGDRILFSSNRSGGPDDWHIFRVSADGGEPDQLTDGPEAIEYNPAMSADGSILAYGKAVATPDGPDPFRDAGIFMSDADGGNERQLTTAPEGGVDERPDISPDGEWIAFSRATGQGGAIFVVNVDGTGLTQLTDFDLEAYRPRWSPDGNLIAFSSNAHRFGTESANVWVVAPDGTGLRPLTHATGDDQAWAPDWAPDGKHVVYVHGADLDVIDLEDATNCTLVPESPAGFPSDPDWGPAASTESGRPVVADGQEWIVFGRQSIEPDGRSTGSQYLVRPDGTGEHRLINDVIGSELRATWSPDGARLAYIQGTLDEGDRDKGGLWIIDADGSDAQHLVGCESPCVAIDYVDWGPDGDTIYFERHSNAVGPDSPPSTFEIWRFDLRTGEAGPVLTRSGDDMTVEQPRVSPDGTRVVYMRQRFTEPDAPSAIFVANLEGGPEQQLTDWDLYASHPDWSVDDLIVLNSYDIRLYKPEEFPGARDLFTIAPDGTNLVRLTQNEPGGLLSGQPRWAPDGTGITYTEWVGDVSHLAFISADGTGQRPLTATGTEGGEPELRPVP